MSFYFDASNNLKKLSIVLGLCFVFSWTQAAEPIRIGSSLPLTGNSASVGQALQAGLQAALDDAVVQGRPIALTVLDDFAHPVQAVDNVSKLIENGVVIFAGNAGTETSAATLPILFDHFIPAFGFHSGSELLLEAPGDILNFRPRYTDEFFLIVQTALAAGLKVENICIYAQNDAFGMAAVKGLLRYLENRQIEPQLVTILRRILEMPGDNPTRNFIGPVGVHPPQIMKVREAFESLLDWEEKTGRRCRLILAADPPKSLSQFAGYALYKGKDWIYSTVSVIGVESFFRDLDDYRLPANRFFATQVVPGLDSNLPIVAQARQALGNELNYIALEGYIVGRLLRAILQTVDGPLTANNFWRSATARPYEVGGITVDFTTNINGSDLITLVAYHEEGEFQRLGTDDLAGTFGTGKASAARPISASELADLLR